MSNGYVRNKYLKNYVANWKGQGKAIFGIPRLRLSSFYSDVYEPSVNYFKKTDRLH